MPLLRLIFATLLSAFLSACGSDTPTCNSSRLTDAEVLGFRVNSLDQTVVRDASRAARHQLRVQLAVDYQVPEMAAEHSLSVNFSLFPSAQALSCPPPPLGNKVVSFNLYSDSDYNQNYLEGDNLTDFLVRDPGNIEGVIPSTGLLFYLDGPLPTLERQHRLTLELTLDSGATHRIELAPITFPETLPFDQPPQESPPLPVSGTGRLNDTGQDHCARVNAGQKDCPVAGLPLQDGDLGRDALARADELTKTGAGEAGFDFTKLDETGEPLPASAENWACVRDNHTGRVWEVKTDEGPRSRYHDYSWYQPDDRRNGGNPGVSNGGDCPDGACDTHSYAQAVNEADLCGRSDWRLPRREELVSLVHYGRSEPSVDPGFFPATEPDWYWTDTAYAGGYDGAWTVDFRTGQASASRLSENHRVRLVSGEPARPATGEAGHCSANNLEPAATESDFEVLAGGDVVRDARTSLEWRRCALGQSWDGADCTGAAGVFTWSQALNRVHEYPGWRLPNIKELSSLVESCRVEPATHPGIFPGTPFSAHSGAEWEGLGFWTGTSVTGRPEQALSVNFRTGAHRADRKFNATGDLGHVRLVRDAAPAPETKQ